MGQAFMYRRGGSLRQFWGTPVGDLEIGESVYMNVDGVSHEFIIVHQGLPSDIYDSSCDGTWLLMKDIYGRSTWLGDNMGYELSKVHSHLNDTFIPLLDKGVQNLVKQVKIPYCTRSGTANNISVRKGANGLSTKAFSLSRVEISPNESTPADGAILDYFKNATDDDREAENSQYGDNKSFSARWWLRSRSWATIYYVADYGAIYGGDDSAQGIRPALILPFETLVDVDHGIILR